MKQFYVMIAMLAVSMGIQAKVIEIKSEQEFEGILKKGKTTVIKFYSPTCPPCKKLAPIFEAASDKAQFKQVTFVAVNAPKFSDLAHQDWGVTGYPTVILVKKDGSEVKMSTSNFEQDLASKLRK